jgi:ATP-binding cassette subfamily F protein 3
MIKDIAVSSDCKSRALVSFYLFQTSICCSRVSQDKPGRALKPKNKNMQESQTRPSSSDVPSSSGINNTLPVEIVAYSQQSRFHRETFDASSSDIDIKGVNVSVNNREILVDAHLRLKAGVRYGMVGQNGVGKSGEFDSSDR